MEEPVPNLIVTKDSLGDRIKAYEERETRRRFLPLIPVVARLDGRSFSNFTRGMARPFDVNMQSAMIHVAGALLDHSDARIAYTQSDEITLVWESTDPKSQIFFDGSVFKMTSVLAGLATSLFTFESQEHWGGRAYNLNPHFDCRVFQVPNREEAANAVLWRERDATKNAITMAAQAHYSHKDLMGKNSSDKQEMLFKKGVNFNDYPAAFKRGTFLRRVARERMLTADELERIPEPHRPIGPVIRHEISKIDMPPFDKVVNRVGVIFEGEAPKTLEEAQG